MGRCTAIYQCFAPNPPQDHSVRGQVPHKVPTRDGKGAGGPCLGWLFAQHCQLAFLGTPQHCPVAQVVCRPVRHREPEVRGTAQVGLVETHGKEERF